MDTYQYRDQLSIDTPEQVSLNLPIAGLGSRMLAHLADLALQAGVYAVLVLFVALAFSRPIGSTLGRLSDRQGLWLTAGVVFVNFLFFWGYYTLFEAFWNGQTPGKRWTQLRVIKDSGRQITFFESMSRNLLRIVDALPSVYITGIITILMSKQNKRLGDLLAGTIVVRQELTAVADAGYSSRTFTAPLVSAPTPAAVVEYGIEFDPLAIARLTTDDLVIVEAFFARIPELDIDTTERIATQMLGILCRKMKIEVPTSPSSRRCLDAIAHALRDIAIYRR
jgi:uncharacterized RDD family membrane protein YckC